MAPVYAVRAHAGNAAAVGAVAPMPKLAEVVRINQKGWWAAEVRWGCPVRPTGSCLGPPLWTTETSGGYNWCAWYALPTGMFPGWPSREMAERAAVDDIAFGGAQVFLLGRSLGCPGAFRVYKVWHEGGRRERMFEFRVRPAERNGQP